MNLKSRILDFFNLEFDILLPLIMISISTNLVFGPGSIYRYPISSLISSSIFILYIIFSFLYAVIQTKNKLIYIAHRILLILVYALSIPSFTYNMIKFIRMERTRKTKLHKHLEELLIEDAQRFKEMYKIFPDLIESFIKEHPEHSEKYKKLNI